MPSSILTNLYLLPPKKGEKKNKKYMFWLYLITSENEELRYINFYYSLQDSSVLSWTAFTRKNRSLQKVEKVEFIWKLEKFCISVVLWVKGHWKEMWGIKGRHLERRICSLWYQSVKGKLEKKRNFFSQWIQITEREQGTFTFLLLFET